METLWSQIQQGKAREFREGFREPSDRIRVLASNRRGFNKDSQTKLSGRPMIIDITPCPYCSS